MKVTFEKLKQIDKVHGRLLGIKTFKETKLGYAFKRFSEKNIKKPFEEYASKLEDLRIDNALEDTTTKAILYEADGSYKFSKEGKKTLIKQMRDEESKWLDKEFEVEPFICKDIPVEVKFEEHEVELLEGLIITSPKKDK